MPARSRQLGPRGRTLWAKLHPAGAKLEPLTETLVEEACRIADRLDKLDAILAGRSDEWVRFRDDTADDPDARNVKVVVDAALAEARQQQTALKTIVSQIEKSRPAAAEPEQPKASATDEVGQRRAARRAGAAAS